MKINPRIFFRFVALSLFLVGFGVASLSAMDDAPGAVQIIVGWQSVKDARVVIKQVDSYGPAWVVIHLRNADGTMGSAIGHAAVCDGQVLYLPVAIDMNKATENLIAVLYMDRGIVGIFEYPGDDVPAKVGGSVVDCAFEVSL